MQVVLKGINFTQGQKNIIEAANDRDIKYILATYSRQCGKSTVVLYLCIRWLTGVNNEIIYFTPTFKLARRFYKKLINLFPKELIRSANATELEIESRTGSILRFYSGEAAESARGSNCTHLIVDEAAYIKQDINGQDFYYNIVLPLIKARGKKVIMISTPFGKSGFFYDLCMQAIGGKKGYRFLKRTIYDDELISKEEIEELRKGYPELAWKCEFECEFMTNALSVFPDYEGLFVDNFNFDTNVPCWCGVDTKSVGTDNTVVTFVNTKNQVRQVLINASLDDSYDRMAAEINAASPVATYFEQNGIGVVEFNEVKKHVVKKSSVLLFETTNETKKEYIGRIQVGIQSADLQFDKKNNVLFSELGTFSYKLTKNGNITYAASGSNHDDTVISLGLALQAKSDYPSSVKENYSFVNIRKPMNTMR